MSLPERSNLSIFRHTTTVSDMSLYLKKVSDYCHFSPTAELIRDHKYKANHFVETITVQDLCDYIQVLKNEIEKHKNAKPNFFEKETFWNDTTEASFKNKITKNTSFSTNVEEEISFCNNEDSKFELLDLS